MRNLNDLIDPALHITLEQATAINDRGQIVADGGGRVYLLTPIANPVPEPSTLTLFGVALLGLGVWARRHPSVFR
jgi:PEP-CTERM motif